MKALVCEMCGSTDIVKQNGVFVCQSCGTKYSVEEAKKMMIEGTVEVKGTVQIDQSSQLDNVLILARRAKKGGNGKEATKYYDEVARLDPNNWEAYYYSLFFSADSCKIGDIPNRLIELERGFDETFEMIKSSVSEKELHKTIEGISSDNRLLANRIINGIAHLDEPWSYQADVLMFLDCFGDKVVDHFGEAFNDISVKCWKEAMRWYAAILSNQPTDDIARMISQLFETHGVGGEEINNKILSIEPDYEVEVVFDDGRSWSVEKICYIFVFTLFGILGIFGIYCCCFS